MLTNRTFSTKAYDARYYETLDEGTQKPHELLNPHDRKELQVCAKSCGACADRAVNELLAKGPLPTRTIALKCDCIDSDAWVCFRGQNIVGMDHCPCPCHDEAERLERAERQIESQRENS